MTVSTPPYLHSRPAKRKLTSPDSFTSQFRPENTPPHQEISPRVIKKARPKVVNAQALRAKTVSRLFDGQRSYDRGEVEMILSDNGKCTFCESPVDTGLPEEEYSCLQCTRVVCGKCGVRQYLSDGDYVACLECLH